MRDNFYSWLKAIFIFSIILSAPASARDMFIGTNGSGLRMRSSPDLKSPVVMVIPDGKKVSVLEEKPEVLTISGKSGKWTKVKYMYAEGWVFGGYLSERSKDLKYDKDKLLMYFKMISKELAYTEKNIEDMLAKPDDKICRDDMCQGNLKLESFDDVNMHVSVAEGDPVNFPGHDRMEFRIWPGTKKDTAVMIHSNCMLTCGTKKLKTYVMANGHLAERQNMIPKISLDMYTGKKEHKSIYPVLWYSLYDEGGDIEVLFVPEYNPEIDSAIADSINQKKIKIRYLSGRFDALK